MFGEFIFWKYQQIENLASQTNFERKLVYEFNLEYHRHAIITHDLYILNPLLKDFRFLTLSGMTLKARKMLIF